MHLDPLLEHYRVPRSECASDDGSTLWQRRPEPLGRGAYGEVWLEENAVEDKLRAVKTVRNPTSERSHFNAEVYALVNLSQRRYRPFFGEFMGFYEDESTVSFFMEYFPARDLRKHLPEGAALPEDQAKSIIRQVLHGVRAMHEQNFTHRDLKPENIFVVNPGPMWRVKIGDFGVAKKISDGRAQLQTMVGTVQYMAPEIFSFIDDAAHSPGKYSDSVDIFSCGVILFELLTGERPFPTHAKLKAYCDGRFGFPQSSLDLSGVSDEGTATVHALLQAQPRDRPTADDALQDVWFAAGADVAFNSPRAASISSAASHPRPSPRIPSTSSPRIPSVPTLPPARPLPAPPKHNLFPSAASNNRLRDEGYHTGSERDVTEMIDFFPPPLKSKSEERKLHSAYIAERTPIDSLQPRRSSQASSKSSLRTSPPIRPPRPDEPFGLPHRPATSSAPTPPPKSTSPGPDGLGIARVRGSRDSQILADFYGLSSSTDVLQEPNPDTETSTPAAEEDADQLAPLSSKPTIELHPRLSSRASTSRSESGFSFQSTTSSNAEIRESVSQKIRDGQWKAGDVIITVQVSRWDLSRLTAFLLKSATPITFTENLHKNYINELPKKIFDALKPWFADNLGPKGSGKALLKEESVYHQRILDDILPYVDLHSSEPEFYRIQLPKSFDVLEISNNLDGDCLKVPAATIKTVIKDHWRLYLEEYVHGFLFNDRAILGRPVRAIVFDEPAHDYALHEQFYRERLGRKLPRSIEYCNFENFRKFCDKVGKVEKADGKKGSKFSKWKTKGR